MKKFLILIFIITCLSAFAQKLELIEDKDKVIERAKLELGEAMRSPEGSIYKFAQEKAIKGEYTFDITVHEKGIVATVFVVGNKDGNIQSQNRLKDFIYVFKFNFKMPKGKSYKFQYVFTFQ
jgi:hypothetical protein